MFWKAPSGCGSAIRSSKPTPARACSRRGVPHTYWNPNPGRVRYLLVMTANIHRLIQAIHAMPDRTPAALKAVFERHDSELIDT